MSKCSISHNSFEYIFKYRCEKESIGVNRWEWVDIGKHQFVSLQVHQRGLKLGIYGDMGLHTCKLYPGSKFYLQLDADTFASWGVDMLKLDCCWAGALTDLETGNNHT